jgi:hypothetical protein
MSYEAFDNAYEHVLGILGNDTKNYTAGDLLYLSDVFERVNCKEDAQRLLKERVETSTTLKPPRVVAA